MHIPKAGEGGIEAGTLLPVDSVFLHGLTHLLIRHLQEVLQAQLARGDFLGKGRERDINRRQAALREVGWASTLPSSGMQQDTKPWT